MSKLIEKISSKIPENVLVQLRKFAPLFAFTAGFIWDSLTLTRVDNLLDNAILLGYLILLGVSIVLMYMAEADKLHSVMTRFKTWYPNIIQFFMGGLFSSYVVFYFHSASMSRTLLFVVLLFGLLVANEFLKDSLKNLFLTMGLYFFVSFAFFTFAIPVVVKQIGFAMFLASGLVSLILVFVITFLLYHLKVITKVRDLQILLGQSVAILVFLMTLYGLNWIPPVPLSVKATGIYHKVKHVEDKYEVTYVKPRWYETRDSDTKYYYTKGDKVYCFTSIFAPAELDTTIYHHWSRYVQEKGDWVETDRIPLEISGGRNLGWRTFSKKSHFKPGRWKVNIKTEEGLLLGEITFQIIKSDKKRELVTDKI